jgi:hypothetical protein
MVVTGMILMAALTRLMPHWPNFTAVGAVALFGAAHLERRSMAVLIPFAAMYLSDLLLNNLIYSAYFSHFTWQIEPGAYIGFALVLGIGMLLRNRVRPGTVFAAGVASSATFFLVSNFGSWLSGSLYPKTAAGLWMAYEAGLPFFWNTLAGDLFFSAALFGSYAWLQQRYPSLAASDRNN